MMLLLSFFRQILRYSSGCMVMQTV